MVFFREATVQYIAILFPKIKKFGGKKMFFKKRGFKKILVLVMAAFLVLGCVNVKVFAANDPGMPVFKGPEQPVPHEPVPYTVNNMLKDIYDLEKAGTDFWIDRMLTRIGEDPSGDWLWTRGRALFMKTHDPKVIGFGGHVAYWESIDNKDAYSITVGSRNFSEDVSKRLQTPSYWKSEYSNGDGINVVVTKFITHQNVATTNLAITNENASSKTLELTVESPYTTVQEGDELTGIVDAKNNLTTIFPRLSGDDLEVDGTKLIGSVTVGAGETVETKVVMGFVTEEIPESLKEYNQYKKYSPEEAFATHVKEYNKWWADNIPYIDVPDDNIKKMIYYRWWLMRFNYLDANIPGNDYQFPTSMEGVLGYNNAIDLTIGMFIQDLKYLRDPMYSYGPWLSVGEVSENDMYRDNPGDPENWSASHTQYISEAAWESYQIHGGQSSIVKNLAHYAEMDVYGQLEHMDSNKNYLLQTDWNAWTGNDADAVSFDYYGRENERTESAYVYSNAKAASEAYEFIGNEDKATEMNDVANKVRDAVLNLLWDDEAKVFKHKDVQTGNLIPWKEINNYYPYAVELVPKTEEYKEAFRLWSDSEEYPIFPFYTANQRDKKEAAAQGKPGTNNFSVINSTVNFRFLGSVLRNYPSEYITNDMYKKLLYWNAWAHYIGGNTQYPDANEFWADWNEETETIEYRSWIHHTILGSNIWTVIEDVMGLRPRTDKKVELWPIDIGWDHFTVNNLDYRGNNMTIVWDKPSDAKSYYEGVPEGYSVYINGKRVFTVDNLVHLIWDPETGDIIFPKEDGTVIYSVSNDEMDAPEDVVLNGRIVDMFQKAGIDLSETGDNPNLALNSTTSASYTASGTSTSAVVDGFTINQPIWGSQGSGNAQDWFEIDFGESINFDTVKLYFFNDRKVNGYSEPSIYSIQYFDGEDWIDVPEQYKTPPYPQANFNQVQFPAVNAEKMRVLTTHRPGYSTGLKEVQVFHTGVKPPKPINREPYVIAKEDTSFNRPAQVSLQGIAKDDGLPNSLLDTTWSVVSGSGSVIFDDPKAHNTVAHFTEPGTYVLEFSVSDGELSSSKNVTVSVEPVPEEVNVALYATPSASYTSPWEDVRAINDGIDPPRSNDTDNPRHGTWPQEGTQWVQLDWESPVKVDKAEVYFFDDNGGVRIPASWKIQYWDGESFVDVENPSTYDIETDQYNRVTFDPVTTTRLRLVMESGQASVGVLEWKTYAVHPTDIRDVHVPTLVGEYPELPSTVQKIYRDGSVLEAAVTWEAINDDQLQNGGTNFTISGIVNGTNLRAQATVYVRETNEVSITSIAEESIVTLVGVPPVLPSTVKATYNDGSVDNVNTFVTWESIDPSKYAEPGIFTVTGTVEGTSIPAKANITVLSDSDTGLPSWPDDSSLTATDVGDDSLTLVWTPPEDGKSVTKYKIFQNGELLDTVDGDTYSYNVAGLTPGTSYTFKVEAGNARGLWSTDGPSVTVRTMVVSTAELKEFVESLAAEGNFANQSAVRSLQVHLMAVNRFEEKEFMEKALKHMKGFKQLLEHQKEKELISKNAFNLLKENTEHLIKKWQ